MVEIFYLGREERQHCHTPQLQSRTALNQVYDPSTVKNWKVKIV